MIPEEELFRLKAHIDAMASHARAFSIHADGIGCYAVAASALIKAVSDMQAMVNDDLCAYERGRVALRLREEVPDFEK